MKGQLRWIFLGLGSIASATESVDIDTDPSYQALPFCAYDCLWNDDNVGDIAGNVSFIFPCDNSCYCDPDNVEDTLAFLSDCILSSSCCDVTDYANAVSLYYTYCDAHEPWSMTIPSDVETAPPNPTTRTTSVSTPTWCSTAHFSPTPANSTTFVASLVSTTSETSQSSKTSSPTVTASSGDDDDDDDDGAHIVSIVLPVVGAVVTVAILGFCFFMIWRIRRLTRKARWTTVGQQQPDAIPLITPPQTPLPSASLDLASSDLTGRAALNTDHDENATQGKDALVPPPPYAP